MKLIITIFLNIVIILAQVDQPCVLPSTSTITIGLKNYVCAKIIYGNITYVYGFSVTVDKLSVLSLRNISLLLLNQTNQANITNQNITVKLQFQNSNKSLQLLLADNNEIVYRNLISVVIRANGGIFSDLVNDSQDCSTCIIGSDVCHLNQCFNRGYFLQQSNLYIYISWIGTDLKQQHMISYTQRLEKLSKFSLSNIYKQAFSIY